MKKKIRETFQKRANVILTFHNDDNLYNDVRPTSERDFIDGKLFIPKNIIDNFLKHLPMRRNYLRYKIEDWFEDNILPDITKKMGRTDIEINEIREYPEKAQVCVPPVEKPEDVTQEVYDTAKFCLDLEYVEADIFTVFNCMMEIG